MAGDEDQLGVVIAPDTAEEAGRCLTTLRAAGFHPTIDYGSAADRLGNFPVLVPLAELGEAKGFLRGLRASHATSGAPALAAAATPVATMPTARQAPARRGDGMLPLAGRALALLTGLLVVAGGIAALASMLHFLSSLRDH